MLTKQQLKILGVFKKNLFGELTFKQLKESSGQKSNNVTQLALEEFQKQELIKTRQTGNVCSYSLNLENNLTLSYLSLINQLELRVSNLPKKLLSELQRRLFKHTEFFIVLVFGSYAKNRKGSDLDLAVIVETEQTKRDITPYLETVKRREIINLHYHVFTRREFLEMLAIEKPNVGKEIYRNNIVYYGLIQYISLIKGGVYGKTI